MTMYNAAAWLVDRHVEQDRGERVALRCDGASVTYGELQRETWRAQRAMRSLGIAEGERVAMVVRDEPAFLAWFLGGLRAGVVPVPLSTMLTGSELAPIVADSGARTIVASAAFADAVATAADVSAAVEHVVAVGDVNDVPIDGAGVAVHGWSDFVDADECDVAGTTSTSPAFWLYSSGTTGVPKGVMHVHGSPQATAETYASNVLDIGERDRFLSIAKLFFAYGLGNSLTFPLAVGATSVLHPGPPTPASMLALIAAEKPTLFFASPGFVAALLDAAPDPSAFTSVRATVTAGESLPGPLHERFAALTGQPVLDGIGSTELLHIFISNTPGDQVAGSSGTLVPGYEAELRDDADELVAEPDTPGYLHVKGPTAAMGYWQRPEATETAFRGDWVRTGDVYMRSADDHWTFLGRNNDMIKAGGIWVSPAEVESVLIEHPDVLEAAVVGARNDDGLETTVAFVVPATGATPDVAELTEHCRERMAAFKRPRTIVVTSELPKTATGKIRRFALRESLQA